MDYSESKYEKRLGELFVKFPSVQKSGLSNGAYKPGLEGMMRLDAVLGHPHKKYKTIHVAGTNGKGSVSSMLAASLAASGRKTGLYTSPHLLDFRERIKTIHPSGKGFEMISKRDVWQFLEKYNDSLDGLSFFEITTGMAFWWFARQGVDAAVIETGLGGRLDSTNIINPEISIITSIGLDHCMLLGDTRGKIAAEKAGIFKQGRPALVWGHDAETDPVFEKAATLTGSSLHYAKEIPDEILPETDLRGRYQGRNICTVLEALNILGIDPDTEAFSSVSTTTGLRGRWEIVSESPLTICDIGHNPAALALNFKQLEESGRPLFIVYGVMADKDLSSIIPLMPNDAEYFLVEPRTPRAMKLDVLFDEIKSARPELRINKEMSVKEAVEKARRMAGPDSTVYIGGSTFVVCEALPLFR